MTDRRLWSYREIAAHIRVPADSVRAYRERGELPEPDLVEGGQPYWFADTIRDWVLRRGAEGRGRRGRNTLRGYTAKRRAAARRDVHP